MEPPSLGQRPELLEALPVDFDLGLLACQAGAALGGEQVPPALAAKAHLPVASGRQIALLDLRAGSRIELRRICDEELPFNLHAETVDWSLTQQGARRQAG